MQHSPPPEDENTPFPPSEKCPICLQPYDDKVVLSHCFHAFCRFCIIQWAEYEPAQRHGKNRCPLCRAQFQALYHNYSDDNKSYEVTYMDADTKGIHWSQYNAEEDARRLLTSETKTQAIIRHRRLLVYSQHLVPIIDFKIPTIPKDSTSAGYAAVSRKILGLFQSKAPSFLIRELPILLFHNTMRPDSTSLHTQQGEVSILTDLIMALIPQCALSLLTFASLQAQTVTHDQLHGSIAHDPNMKALMEEIEPFFREWSEAFLRELTLFVVSPYTLSTFDERVKYVDPSEGEKEDSVAE